MSRRLDWVSLIEKSYDLESDGATWLRRIFDESVPLLEGVDATAWSFHCTPTTFRLQHFPRGSSKAIELGVRAFHRLGTRSWLDLVYRSGHVVDTASNACFPHQPDMRDLFEKVFGRYARDVLMVGAHSGMGQGVVLATMLKDHAVPTLAQRKRWPQIAAHIGAGLRLRAAVAGLPLDAPTTEAIFEPSGKLCEARHGATEQTARARLREAVLRIDQARTVVGRSDPDGAMDAWEGLVDGRWSLVDRFDSDGRRFIVAVRNDPGYPDPRGLSLRERQVAEFVGLGQSSKEVAYTLGLSLSAVTNAASAAMTKLGLSGRAELAAYFSPASPRAKMAEIIVGNETLLLASSPLVDERNLSSLTDAERDVVSHLIAGSTNADIAERRGTSVNTVAAQVQAIYRKCGARSRSELATRLQTNRSPDSWRSALGM